MQCRVVEIDVDPVDHVAYVEIDPGNACDMSGCVATVKQIDPGVVQINVFSGDEPDVRYSLVADKWEASRLIWKEPAAAISA